MNEERQVLFPHISNQKKLFIMGMSIIGLLMTSVFFSASTKNGLKKGEFVDHFESITPYREDWKGNIYPLI